MRPERRAHIGGKDVFIADGFSTPPHINFHLFGLGPDEFPFGCFLTVWFSAGEKSEIEQGAHLAFDAIQADSRDQPARLRAAIADATEKLGVCH